MLKIFMITLAALAVGVLAACDSGPTGPTATGGEVTLEVFEHRDYFDKDTGEGYNFETCEKIALTPFTGGENVDICSFPTRIEPYDVRIDALSHRIYIEGNNITTIYLQYNKSAEFELVTVSGKARYKISIQNRKVGFDPKRNGTVSVNTMRYQIIE